MTIPKEITEKIKEFNKLQEEIKSWFEENLDIDDCYSFPNKFVLTDSPEGHEQYDGEYCLQFEIGDSGDSFEGRYFYPTEDGEYLQFEFWV